MILILVETLRIGGIERNTLDQAYQLSDNKESCIILIFDKNNTFKNANFIDNETNLITSKKIDIRFCKDGIFGQINSIFNILKSEDINFVIDNTLSGTLKIRLINIFLRKQLKINAVVQQFASLSAPVQRYKRMLYAQFCTNLIINSVNYGIDWNYHRNRNIFTKLIFKKKFEIVRNGVYIPRLSASSFRPLTSKKVSKQKYRFIFLGRLKYWKGIHKFKEIDRMTNYQMTFLIITSEIDDEVVDQFTKLFGNRVKFIFGKTLNSYLPKAEDIHIYPVDYGAGAPAIEAVSTNCLEMAQLGVPSVVTSNGTNNWPELVQLKIIFEVDWKNKTQFLKTLKKSVETNFTEKTREEITNLINIENNLNAHKKYFVSF